jgi:hypothetical protein
VPDNIRRCGRRGDEVLQVGDAECLEDFRARLATQVVVKTTTAEVRQLSANLPHELRTDEVFALQSVGRIHKGIRFVRVEPRQNGTGLTWPESVPGEGREMFLDPSVYPLPNLTSRTRVRRHDCVARRSTLVVDKVETVSMPRDTNGPDTPPRRQQIHNAMDDLGDIVPDEPRVALVVTWRGMEHRHGLAASYGSTAAKVERGGLDIRATDVQAQQEGCIH